MNHNLHQAQSHDVARAWQSQRNDISHPIDFILPLFICNDDDSIESINSMPDVFRYGCNKIINYLEPLVKVHNLKSVLLFPVPSKSDVELVKNQLVQNTSIEPDEDNDISPPSLDSSCSQRSDSSLTDLISMALLKPLEEVDVISIDSESLSQNPFLNRSQEEDHLLDQDREARVPSIATVNKPSVTKRVASSAPVSSKLLEMELVKIIAFQEKYNPLLRLLPRLKAEFPGLSVVCDVCLCAFTSTGHCCIFEDSFRNGTEAMGHMASAIAGESRSMSNKATCRLLAQLSVEYASRGCDIIAPSDMMDGRIRAIRKRLDSEKLDDVSIMSYSAKFASAFYGPFRQATNNAPEFGDRRAYQLPPGSRALALRAVKRDIAEGADFIMVKPGGAYLDVIRDISNNHPEVPIAVYQVSGEYSMLKLAGKEGLIDYKKAVNETLTSFRRAGASILITYFAPEILRGEL